MAKFRRYEPSQGLLFPSHLEDFIEPGDMVRVVNRVIDCVDGSLLERGFEDKQSGGAPAYSPRMMLKLLIYGYCCGIRSCRRIAQAVRRDVGFMWLAGMQRPDFRTVNRFRSVYLRKVLPEVFAQVVKLLVKEGYVRFEDVFVDGSKFAADANKHKIVWSKNVERYEEALRDRVTRTLKEIERLNKEEDTVYGDGDLPERGESRSWSSDDLQRKADEINERLREQVPSKEVSAQKKERRQLKEDAEKLKRYEGQKKKLNGRSSFSKTDPDATAMYMKNEELRPGYNMQIMAENGFVTGVSVSHHANDGTAFPGFLEENRALGLPQPERIVGDAGYGHEQNYVYLQNRGIEGYLKYPAYHKENSTSEKYRFHASRFTYDADSNCFLCPAGRKLEFVDETGDPRAGGYVSKIHHFRSSSCKWCRYRKSCAPKAPRMLQVSLLLRQFQNEARERLDSEQGRALRKRRGHEVESVFGDWKHNRGFTRFQVRGLAKVKAESYLQAISHNIRRWFSVAGSKPVKVIA